MSVTGTSPFKQLRLMRMVFAALISFALTIGPAITPAQAASEQALYLYYTHTKETARIVFKRNGQYVQAGLKQLNYFLRDWRRNEPTKMDPALFDLVWQVYQDVGASQPINIVSAYRAPATNEMLRAKTSGVAKNSQHTKGHAMDFYIPGISLTKLRTAAMKRQVGGVGYYPTSGSPFVHLDTGNVRAWPRMTRAQLKQVFPDGKTLHVPTDGKPLSNAGYQYAKAEWQRCHTVPCATGASRTRVASNDSKGSGTTLMDLFFGDDEDEDSVTPAPTPQTQLAALAPVVAPIPAMPSPQLRQAVQLAAAQTPTDMPFSTTGSAPLTTPVMSARIAPVPASKSRDLMVATAAALPAGQTGETALTALAALGAPLPAPRAASLAAPASIVAAYASSRPESGERATATAQPTAASQGLTQTAVLPLLPGETPQPRQLKLDASNLRTASLGGAENELGALAGIFDMTWGAVEQDGRNLAIERALAQRRIGAPRQVELIAPDLEHVNEVFLTPVAMSSEHFAVIFDHDEADFSPATELGADVTYMGVGDIPPYFSARKFTRSNPLKLATR